MEYYENNDKLDNKFSQDTTTLVRKPKEKQTQNNLGIEMAKDDPQGDKKSCIKYSGTAQPKHKKQKMRKERENQSITSSSIGEDERKDEAEVAARPKHKKQEVKKGRENQSITSSSIGEDERKDEAEVTARPKHKKQKVKKGRENQSITSISIGENERKDEAEVATRPKHKKQEVKKGRENQSITSSSIGEDERKDEAEVAARPKHKKQEVKKGRENQSITSSSIGEDKRKDEAEVASPSRISKCSRLDDNTLNSSMDYLCKESAANDQETSGPNAQDTSEAGPSRGPKCLFGLDDNIFNNLRNFSYEECKINNQETSNSNAQARSEFYKNVMVILPIEYPERKLTSNEISAVRRLVMDRILSMSKDAKFPCFHNNIECNGLIIFDCANKETGEWLSNLTSELTLDGGVRLHMLDIDKLSKLHRAIVFMGDLTITFKDILFFLENQNEDLVIDYWNVVSCRNTNILVVYFGDTSLEVLKALEFRPFCALDRAKLIDKKYKWNGVNKDNRVFV